MIAVSAVAIAGIAGCANAPTEQQPSTVAAAAAPGQNACADLAADNHILIRIRGTVLAVAAGAGPADLTQTIADLAQYAALSPAGLQGSVQTLQVAAQQMQDGTAKPSATVVDGAAYAVAGWCQSHGFPVPDANE